jgi:hypothetical protein
MSQTSTSISFLIGAGFSAPKGYPTGRKLNSLILNSKNENIAFHTSGSLVINTDGTKPDLGFKSSHQIEFDFFCKLVEFYNARNKEFDYEEFYDYITNDLYLDASARRIAETFTNDKRSIDSLFSGQKKILNQLATFYLKDSDGNKSYDNQPYMLDKFYPGYNGIMGCISELSNRHIINIHTLNHDLFFESLNRTDFLKGELSDGFEELGSKYFGKLEVEGRSYMVRLERYSGNYNGKFRLYKLHGSLDYELFYRNENGTFVPDVYIKSRYGIGHTNQYKEVKYDNEEMEYQNSWINYHSDFLSGTTSKIKRYNEPLLFNKLIDEFRKNLENSEKLIIIGYGGRDKEINKMIFQHQRFWRNQIVIIDPYPGEILVDLAWKLQARIIKKQLNDIQLKDIWPH